MLKEEIVMFVLCRKIIAGLFIDHIQSNTQMRVFDVYEFNKVRNMALVHKPVIALVEIPERHGDPAQDALDVCNDIKEASPGCKIMLMCPENDDGSVGACVDAMKKGKIEDFLFYDASPEYLTSKLESMLPA